jgi:hypothetical protein
VFVWIDGVITGDDTAAVELICKISTNETDVFVRITMLRAGQKGHARWGMVGHTYDDVKPRAFFND